jgi:transposase
MHLVAKQVKGHEYYYLVEKGRQSGRVVTIRTVYIGNRQKLAELVTGTTSAAAPESYSTEQVGASLALASIASDLGIEDLIDEIASVRDGAAPVGRRLVLAAIHRVLAPRGENGLKRLLDFYRESSVLSVLLPLPEGALDDRRIGDMLAGLTARQIEDIESAVVRRLVEREGISLNALGFDCSNFDSFAGPKTRSRLLQRGHNKSGRSLRALGLGLLVTEDDGMPLLSFVYPGNENDVTAFGRFLKRLDRRQVALGLPVEATVAGDGGNISKQMVLKLEKDSRYYVLRLPPRHLVSIERAKRSDLRPLGGKLKAKVWAHKMFAPVYGAERCVVDVYSRRMHQRQLPGLRRDRDRARKDLQHLQEMLERQRQGLRRAKPLTVKAVKTRVEKALAREHMADLFRVTIKAGQKAPVITFEEPAEAWTHLEEHVLGRTLLVTNRKDWTSEQIVDASRKQSHNERVFRDLKDPGGVSMLPLRHRRDAALRAHVLLVMLGLLLAKVAERRLKRAGVPVTGVPMMLRTLKSVQRAKLAYGPDAPPALRALAEAHWVPSARTPLQNRMLEGLGIAQRSELGTTIQQQLSPKKRGRRPKAAA